MLSERTLAHLRLHCYYGITELEWSRPIATVITGGKAVKGTLAQTPYDQLTYRVIGCAMAVHRARGPGYREDTYQRDLELHFTESGLAYQAQVLVEVYDSVHADVLVGYYIPAIPHS